MIDKECLKEWYCKRPSFHEDISAVIAFFQTAQNLGKKKVKS